MKASYFIYRFLVLVNFAVQRYRIRMRFVRKAIFAGTAVMDLQLAHLPYELCFSFTLINGFSTLMEPVCPELAS